MFLIVWTALYVWQKSSDMHTDRTTEQRVLSRHFMHYQKQSNKTSPHEIDETAISLHDKTVRSSRSRTRNLTSVYICALSKSRAHWQDVHHTPVMKYLVKSINETRPQSITSDVLYEITVLIGVDQDDTFWLKHGVILQSSAMLMYQVNLRVHRYTRHKSGKLPFNSLMQDAFDANADYLVRVNDDTQFETRGWVPRAVNQLMAFVPANVGVVGPVCHQGNTAIMVHDMVHRTHLHIFPTYYPSVFHNWYIDDWISAVYGSARTVKMKTWQVHHHVELGTRYIPALGDKLLLAGEVAAGAVKISGYLQGNTLDVRLQEHEEHVS